jgi:hypothetical protein
MHTHTNHPCFKWDSNPQSQRPSKRWQGTMLTETKIISKMRVPTSTFARNHSVMMSLFIVRWEQLLNTKIQFVWTQLQCLLLCNNFCTIFRFVVQVCSVPCADFHSVSQWPLLYSLCNSLPASTFLQFTFPACPNCFRLPHHTVCWCWTSRSVAPITVDSVLRYNLPRNAILCTEHHVVYCLHCALRSAQTSFVKMAFAV